MSSHWLIFIVLNLLRCVLCPRMRSALANIPFELEKNVYSAIVGWRNLKMSIMYSWLMALLCSTISLLIFCLLNLSISNGELLKSSNVTVDSSISLCLSISFYIYFVLYIPVFFLSAFQFWKSFIDISWGSIFFFSSVMSILVQQ